MVAQKTGESVVVGSLSPTLSENQFMSQFYGSAKCIFLLDQLSRVGILSAPNDPAQLNGTYFVCLGTYNASAQFGSGESASWPNLPNSFGQAAFPEFFTSPATGNGINGTEGTLDYFANTNPSVLGSACVNFLNASTQYGYDTPSAYISSLDCVSLGTDNGKPLFLSVNYANCANTYNSCASSPWVFLHGSPGAITLQTCNYASGAESLICSITVG
jgi:hypothetical protein